MLPRTALSKSLLATPVADLLLRGDAFYEKLAVDVRLSAASTVLIPLITLTYL